MQDYADELQAYGQRFAIASGAVKACDQHPHIIEIRDSQRLEVAYRMANAAISRGEIDVDRTDLTDAIKDVFDQAAYDCPACDKLRAE